MQLSITSSIDSISQQEWNRIAEQDEYSPFLEYQFLCSVELAGCAAPSAGWHPNHFVLSGPDGLIGAAPAYVKTNSNGEFIFDQGIATQVIAAGLDYYPKLVATLPFTPCPGYQFLTSDKADIEEQNLFIIEGMREFAYQSKYGSASILFPSPCFDEKLQKIEHLNPWSHQYFLWLNENYETFDDYLHCFNKNQRRNIVRERASIRNLGIEIRIYTGEEIDSGLMKLMFKFYHSTNQNFGPWGALFLNEEWFCHIARVWTHRIILVAAYLPSYEVPIAMSMLIRKNRHLYGRYWGDTFYIPNLHFELCYYTPIEYAIAQRISDFDPGMGSRHKARRGFRSYCFNSYHNFTNRAVREYFGYLTSLCDQEELNLIEQLNNSVPWAGQGAKTT